MFIFGIHCAKLGIIIINTIVRDRQGGVGMCGIYIKKHRIPAIAHTTVSPATIHTTAVPTI